YQLNITGHGHFGTLGSASQFEAQLLQVNLEVFREVWQHIAVRAGSGYLEGNHGLAAGLNLHDLTDLHAVGRTVHDLAVNEDVTVGHGLACLGDGAAETGAEHERVE